MFFYCLKKMYIWASEKEEKMARNINTIVFDFGGVLIDWNPEYLYRKVFHDKNEMHYFLQHVCTRRWNEKQDAGRPLVEATKLLQEEFPTYRAEIAMFYDRWNEMLGGTIDDNVRLIEPLKKSYRLYGLTNWSAETLPIAKSLYDFFQYLDGIVVSGEEKLLKPQPEIYRILMNRYQIQPNRSMFIDDNIENIKTAEELGFKAIHYTPKMNLSASLKEYGILIE